MYLKRIMGIELTLFIILTLIGCGGNGDTGSTSVSGTGTVSVSLVDKTTYDYEAVYVTIDEVQVHLGGNENSPNNWRSTNMPVSPITVSS